MTDFPKAQAHGPIEEIFPDIFFVQGSAQLAPGMRLNRNMVVVRQGGDLSLIGAVRLSSEGEKGLGRLGTVKNVLRIGDFHGLDDAYCVDRFDAKFWGLPQPQAYSGPAADHILKEGVSLPFDQSQYFAFHETKLPEGAILLRRHGGLLITCDSLQNWTDRNRCSVGARLLMPLLGFKLKTLVGPPWIKKVSQEGGDLHGDFKRILELEFQHFVGAHGRLRRSDAHEAVADAVEHAFG